MGVRMKYKFLICSLLIAVCCFPINAQDFGIVLDQNGDFTDSKAEYTGTLIPRLNILLGDNADIFMSAGINFKIDANNPENYSIIPELLRTEAAFRFGMGELRVGRILYQDPLGLIAAGLFDGAAYSQSTKYGNFNIGGFYTGLLYKERASIEMTFKEKQLSELKVDYNNFADTYFAPRRTLVSLGWNNPSLLGRLDIKTALIGQFDLTDENLHTQYAAAKIAIPLSNIIFDIGGSLELLQQEGNFNIALMGELGIAWLPSLSLPSKFSFTGQFTSGVFEDSNITAFIPLSTVPQGNMLNANISGLSILSLDYLVRLKHTLSANVNVSYFIRSDLGTYKQYPVIGIDSDGYFLGAEIYGQLFWNISTGVRMNLGAGVFLPSLGDAAPNADMLWRAELNLIISIY